MDNKIYRCTWNGKQCRKIGEPIEVLGQKFEYSSNGHYFFVSSNEMNLILTEEEWLKCKNKK